MSKFGYALQLVILLTVLGATATFVNIRSAWAQEAEITSQIINSTEQTCLPHTRCTVALEVTGKSSDIEKNKCMETVRRLNMEQQFSDSGIITKPSKCSVEDTLDRLEAVLKSKGITIFARIDQKAAAESVGLVMQPTELLVFGDPKTGTPLMNSYPSLAIDLPLKAIAWQSKNGRVFLSFNSPEYLKQRHRLAEAPFKAVEALIDKALE